MIRELHEEVEKLRQLLKDQGGPSGTAANPADSQDIIMLREKLSISENLMQEMSKTWEQKLVESEKLHQVSDQRRPADMTLRHYRSGRRLWKIGAFL